MMRWATYLVVCPPCGVEGFSGRRIAGGGLLLLHPEARELPDRPALVVLRAEARQLEERLQHARSWLGLSGADPISGRGPPGAVAPISSRASVEEV